MEDVFSSRGRGFRGVRGGPRGTRGRGRGQRGTRGGPRMFIPPAGTEAARFRTIMCKFAKKNKPCPMIKTCKFAHEEDQLRSFNDPMPKLLIEKLNNTVGVPKKQSAKDTQSAYVKSMYSAKDEEDWDDEDYYDDQSDDQDSDDDFKNYQTPKFDASTSVSNQTKLINSDIDLPRLNQHLSSDTSTKEKEIARLKDAFCTSELEKREYKDQLDTLKQVQAALEVEKCALVERSKKLEARLNKAIQNDHARLDQMFEDNNINEREIVKHVLKVLDQIISSDLSGEPIEVPVLTPSLGIADQNEIAQLKSQNPDHRLLVPKPLKNVPFKPLVNVIQLRDDIHEMIAHSSKDGELERLTIQNQNLKTEIKMLNKKISDLKSEVGNNKNLVNKNAALKLRAEEFQSRADTLKNELEQLKNSKENDSKVSQLNMRIAQLNNTVNQLRSQKEKLTEKAKSGSNPELIQENSLLKSFSEKLTERVKTLESELDKVKASKLKKSAKLSNKINALTNTVNQLREEKDKLKKGKKLDSSASSVELYDRLVDDFKEILECPITSIRLQDPVLTPCGYTIEKTVAEQLIKQGKPDPMTNTHKFKKLVPNVLVAKALNLVKVFEEAQNKANLKAQKEASKKKKNEAKEEEDDVHDLKRPETHKGSQQMKLSQKLKESQQQILTLKNENSRVQHHYINRISLLLNMRIDMMLEALQKMYYGSPSIISALVCLAILKSMAKTLLIFDHDVIANRRNHEISKLNQVVQREPESIAFISMADEDPDYAEY